MFTQKATTLATVAIKIALAIVLVTPTLIMQTSSVQAGTNVGGPIISDTTWTLANSPYIVTTSVDVQQNVTLTIEPGVTIRFNGGTKLQINGELIARGTANSLIVFTSNQANPAPGDWDGIEFTSIAVPVIMDTDENYVSGNIMQYCVVEYAGFKTANAITAYLHLIDNCTIQNNRARGIWIQGGYVTNSIIRNNYRSDLGDGGGINAENSIIRNNVVTGNFARYGGGIFAKFSELTGNTLIGNTTIHPGTRGKLGGGIYSDRSTVVNNIVSNNSAVSGGGIYSYGNTVSQNIVNGNSAVSEGGGIWARSTRTSENIVNNNSASTGGGIYAYLGTVLTNTIVANQVSGYNPKGSGVYYHNFYGGGDILHNTIVNNRGPEGSIVGGLQIGYVLQVHHNTFYGNTPYDVAIDSSGDISGTHNYWGTVANVDILAQIYDWYDDDSRGKFLYVPYLQEPSPDTPLPPPTGLSMNFQDDSVILSWDALPSFTTGWGYKIYYDTDSSMPPFAGTGLNEGDAPIDVGDRTSYTLTGLDPNTDYYFAVTAYDNLGREGWYSNVARKLGGYWVYLPLVIKK